jgi:hypothetical protein
MKQTLVENKNLKIFMTMNVGGHKTLIRVYIPAVFEKNFLLITNLIGLSGAPLKD